MRPALLNPLFASLASLRGIGTKQTRTFARLLKPDHGSSRDDPRVMDLLWHIPTGILDRRRQPVIADLAASGIVTVDVSVTRHIPSTTPRAPYRVECRDETGTLNLIFFNPPIDYLTKALPVGARRYISGEVSWFSGAPQIVHPDYIVAAEDFAQLPLVEPVYPLTFGLYPKILRKAMAAALAIMPDLPEWQDWHWLKQQGWPGAVSALKSLHAPQCEADLDPENPARARLAYDELLAGQLALALMRRHLKKSAGRVIRGTGRLRQAIIAKLPFELTEAQKDAIDDILRDMEARERMGRLLQGDVGSGKTIVALIALAAAVEAGFQGVLMAPTELLARQHFNTLTPYCGAACIGLEILTGRETGKSRRAIVEKITDGRAQIIIGTHALFQNDVVFADPGLIVIDEQHRFGVHQRLALRNKAAGGADMLVMTATPIPRTLQLTLYGDMDISHLREKPGHRPRIETRILAFSRLDDVVQGLARALDDGARAYWVCPLVMASENSDLTAVEARYAALSRHFPGRVGLLHGRMKGAEKDKVMEMFCQGEITILVATTVVEVGVDVPEATIMVIENAERFGLAQLHQLRGRVGRGLLASSCLLLYQGPLGENARKRLKIMRESDDGFVIAEQDLRLRGAGEILGARQSGMPVFRIADPGRAHASLLAAARNDCGLILARDPELVSERGQALRILLYLFERDEAVRTLTAG
ncbi:MAG: ATP-dependent DNA helicase RecG [Hyphomicrobiales bacterium]